MKNTTVKRSNGETRRQMEHAQAIKAMGADTTVDQEWKVNSAYRINDCYAWVTTGIWLLIKMPLMMPFVLLSALPICILARCFGACLATPTDEVKGGRCKLFFVCFPFVLLYMFCALVAFLFDCFVYYLFSLPFFALRLVLRHGVLESAWRCSFMIMVIPWMKYYLATNSWLYNLEERFVQQLSTSLADLPLEDVSLTARRIISRTKQDPELRLRQDMWKFVPHYPYPPEGRNYALGLQAGGSGLAGTFLIVHTTHALEVGSTKMRDPDWFVLSNSVELPCYRVMLWYNNPYHHFTGFVEASTTTGAPSQLDKKNGGEHPMWLVATRSPMLSKRDGLTGPGSVDGFFDRWLPNFVDEVRRLLRGEEYAKQMHEEVISKDGISRPAGKKVPAVV